MNYPLLGIYSIGLWLIGSIIVSTYQSTKWKHFKEVLRGRVVRLDPSVMQQWDVEPYAEIEDVAKEVKRRILSINVSAFSSEESIKQAKKDYDKEHEERMRIYDQQVEEFNRHPYPQPLPSLSQQKLVQQAYAQELVTDMSDFYQMAQTQYAQGYVNQQGYYPPTKPMYDFQSSRSYKTFEVKKNLTKLMPIGFDIQSETIIRDLNKKEVKKRRTMPRIFKLSAFAAGSVLIWDFVIHANQITPFLWHAFTGK